MANLLENLKKMDKIFFWMHKCIRHFKIDIPLVERAFVRNAISFSVILDDGDIETYFAHTCSTMVKHKCRCYLIEEYLIIAPKTPRMNPNYFSGASITPYLQLLRSFQKECKKRSRSFHLFEWTRRYSSGSICKS